MTTTTETLSDLQAVFASQGTHMVGAIVMWSLRDVHAERGELRAALEAIGLGVACPRDPKPERILAKAVEACGSGQRGILVRRLSKSTHAIIQERETDSEVLELDHTITMGLATVEGVTSAVSKSLAQAEETAGAPEPSDRALALAAKIGAEYDRIRKFANTDDMSVILTTAMLGTYRDNMLGALSLREGTGGVYFVPGSQIPTLVKLQELLHGLPGNSRMTVLSIYGDTANLAETAATARASFTAKLNELRQELGAFVQTLKSGDKEGTESHAETRLRRLDNLRDRVDMWGDILGDVRAELFTGIESAKAEVVKALGL